MRRADIAIMLEEVFDHRRERLAPHRREIVAKIIAEDLGDGMLPRRLKGRDDSARRLKQLPLIGCQILDKGAVIISAKIGLKDDGVIAEEDARAGALSRGIDLPLFVDA